MRRPLVQVVFILLLSSLLPAQNNPDKVDLRVKVLYNSSRPARNHTEVQLLSGNGLLVAEKFTDDTGNAEFPQLDPGNYRIRVVDSIVEENMSDVITLLRREFSQFQLITVPLKKNAEAEIKQQEATEALVSALDLNVPSAAKKEFEKGAQAMQDGDNANALQHLQRAVDLYPQYAMAWNHLGVVYMQANQPDKGTQAFEKAVALNDHYPSALINLAKVRWGEKKPGEVEGLMRKAVAADPTNVEGLAILCNALLVNGKLEEAIADASRFHSLALHQRFALVHFLVARALLKQQRREEAATQLQLFLQEAPTSPMAAQARQALTQLTAARAP